MRRILQAIGIALLVGCGPLSEDACLDSPNHLLVQPDNQRYQCVRAENHCESGFIQNEHDAEDCEAKPGCVHDPGRCYCPRDVQCICGGGPPQSCRPAQDDGIDL